MTVKAASAAGYAAGNVNITEAQLAWALGPQEITKGNALGQLLVGTPEARMSAEKLGIIG